MRLVPIQTVNGHDMSGKLQPAKDGYSVTKSDLYSDSTGRSLTGVMQTYIVRKDVYSIEVKYIGTAAQIAEIEAIYAGASRQYSMTFLDNGEYVTKTMYPSDRSKTTSVIIDGIPHMELSLSLIEI